MSAEDMTALHLIIHGRVQGVGYRDWLTSAATTLHLSGWVRNLSDGTVEAVISGPRAAVEACLVACRQGPVLARVSNIESTACPPLEGGCFVKKSSTAR